MSSASSLVRPSSGGEYAATSATSAVLLGALGVMWMQLFVSCISIWQNSEYYTYGWYVPPAALLFFLRRWKSDDFDRSELRPIPVLWPLGIALALLVPLFAIRTLGHFDASWRPPILLHAGMVAVISHGLLALAAGWRRSLWFLPLTIFALSAVPHPFQVEQTMIRQFTGWVIDLSVEWFALAGRPVSAVGERLESLGTVVEVTQGCSGIRSFQSILMASLFFGELFFLRIGPRLVLVVLGLGVTLLVNTGRAIALATIRFDRGEEAFKAAHDSVGMIAFAVSAAILLLVALLLRTLGDRRGRRRLVVRKV